MKNKLDITKYIKNFDKQVLYEFKEKNIITDLYQYYFYNGFNNICTEKIVQLLISYLLLFIINFILNCIDYASLITITEKEKDNSIFDYIHISKWIPTNPYLIICFIIYCVYLFCITINCFNTIKKFWKIRKIYIKYLKINDNRLKFINWDEIIDIIIDRFRTNNTNTIDDMLDTSDIDIYTINNKICLQSNIIIAMMRSNLISLPKLSKFLEWNYIFCIIDPMTIIKFKTSIENRDSGNSGNGRNSGNGGNETIGDVYINGCEEESEMIKKYENDYNIPLLPVVESVSSGGSSASGISIGSSGGSGCYDGDNCKMDNVNIEGVSLYEIGKLESMTSSSSKKAKYFDNVLYNTAINNTICNIQISEINEYMRRVNYRINLVIFINIIAMPFMILILMVYLIIQYGEKIYINPSILFERKINTKTLWQIRYYNELPNLFKERIAKIEKNMNKIMNSYFSITYQILLRFAIFIIGSIFISLLSISFIATEYFSQLNIFYNHNIIWLLGITGTLLIIFNKSMKNDTSRLGKTEKIKAFHELRENLITLNPKITHIEDREYLVNIIKDIYQLRIMYIVYEFWYLITAPYYIWQWKREIVINNTNILDIIENHYTLGTVCKYSIFTNTRELYKNSHMILSMKEFKNNHNWNLPEIVDIDCSLQNSILLRNFF